MCYEIVIFPIRKWHFRVRGWSGAFSEPLERKKDKTKCSYKTNTLLHRSNLKILQKFSQTFCRKMQKMSNFFINFVVFRADFDES